MTEQEIKELDWQPLMQGANDSVLFSCKINDKTWALAGGEVKGDKIRLNLATMFTMERKS